MLLLSFSGLLALLPAISLLLTSVIAAPAVDIDQLDLDEPARRLLKRAKPSAPRFVAYSDKYSQNGPPSASAIKGFNVFALSFLLSKGAADQAQEWAALSSSQRSNILKQYHDAGISLVVSAFGSTDTPTTSGVNPTAVANTMAAWVKKYGLDGIDVDYEDLNAMNAQNGKAEQWLTTFTKQLRSQLPQNQYILTHAPLAPWFSGARYKSGAYLTVNKNVGSMIDWYNVQFYNQGSSEYTSCSGLLTKSSSTFPKTSVFEIASSGVTLDKIVIGKPANTADASTGYIAPSTLASCVQQAKNKGWDAGVMVWEYPDAAASWIKTVRSESWPV